MFSRLWQMPSARVTDKCKLNSPYVEIASINMSEKHLTCFMNFVLVGDAIPCKSNKASSPRYPVLDRESAAFISTFKDFLWKKIRRKILKVLH